ncbi:hypothetical protein, partial [Acrocarpospora catenulata]|uniref:hypothetical protein n=1 Tax=Acrocarpospora catenulata TaxID=2836182 RepID=UPI001BDA74E1
MPDFSRSPATWPRTLLAATGAATVLVTAGTGIWLAINSGDAPQPLFPRPAALSDQTSDQEAFAPAGPTPAATSPTPSATPSAHLGAVAGGLLGSTADRKGV